MNTDEIKQDFGKNEQSVTFKEIADYFKEEIGKRLEVERKVAVQLISPATILYNKLIYHSPKIQELLSVLQKLGEQHNIKTESTYMFSTIIGHVAGMAQAPVIKNEEWKVQINMILAEGGLGNNKDFADTLSIIFHEFRHIEQAEERINGTIDKDMLMEEIIMEKCPLLYLRNYQYVLYEIDAYRAGILQTYSYLKENHPEIDALKWAQKEAAYFFQTDHSLSSCTIEDIDEMFRERYAMAKETPWKDPGLSILSFMMEGSKSMQELIRKSIPDKTLDVKYALSSLVNLPDESHDDYSCFTQRSFLAAAVLAQNPEYEKFIPVKKGSKYDIEVYKTALEKIKISKEHGLYEKMCDAVKTYMSEETAVDAVIFQKLLRDTSKELAKENNPVKEQQSKPRKNKSQIEMNL